MQKMKKWVVNSKEMYHPPPTVVPPPPNHRFARGIGFAKL